MLLTRAKTTAGTRAPSSVCQFTGIAGESGMRLSRAMLAVVSDRTHTDNEAGHPNWAGHPPAVMWNGFPLGGRPRNLPMFVPSISRSCETRLPSMRRLSVRTFMSWNASNTTCRTLCAAIRLMLKVVRLRCLLGGGGEALVCLRCVLTPLCGCV